MYNICTIYVQYMYNICTIYVQYMYNICVIYVQYMYHFSLMPVCTWYASYYHICLRAESTVSERKEFLPHFLISLSFQPDAPLIFQTLII